MQQHRHVGRARVYLVADGEARQENREHQEQFMLQNDHTPTSRKSILDGLLGKTQT